MKLISISEMDKNTYRKMIGTVRRTGGDMSAAAEVGGLKSFLDVYDYLPKSPEAGQPVDETEQAAGLRNCYKLLRQYGVPSDIIDKLLVFYRKRPRNWDIQSLKSPQDGVDAVLQGRRLICWINDIGDVNGLDKLVYGSNTLYFKPENRDLAEYLASHPIRSNVGNLINGLAFGYPTDRVYKWVTDHLVS